MLENTPSKKFQRLAISLVPVLLTVILLAFITGFFNIQGFSETRPRVTIISVYYWTLFYPRLLPYPAAFAIGFIEDSISGGVFGLSALTLVLTRYLTQNFLLKLVKQGFAKIWTGFFLLMLLLGVIEYVVTVSLGQTILSFEYPILQVLFTALVYPVFHLFFTYIHSIIFKS